MIIKVTEEHIKKGVPSDGRSCPVACALKDAGFRYAGVGWRFANIDGKQVRLPAIAYRFIEKFDNGEPVSPFSFRIKKPY